MEEDYKEGVNKLPKFTPVFATGEINTKTEEEIKVPEKLAASVRLENLMGHGRFQQFQIWVFAALVCLHKVILPQMANGFSMFALVSTIFTLC